MSLTDTHRNSEVSGEASLSLNVQDMGANGNRCRLRRLPSGTHSATAPPSGQPADQKPRSLFLPDNPHPTESPEAVAANTSRSVVLWCAGAFELITNCQRAVHNLATKR